jgi:hypothetical protein
MQISLSKETIAVLLEHPSLFEPDEYEQLQQMHQYILDEQFLIENSVQIKNVPKGFITIPY